MTPSLPASGHGEVAGLVEELRRLKVWDDRPTNASLGDQAADLIEAQSAELAKVAAVVRWIAVAEVEDPFAAMIDECEKSEAKVAELTAQLAALTPSPVEARADGVREAIERLAFGYELMHQTLCHIAGTSGADRHWYTQKAGEVTERITRVGEVTGSSNPGKPGDCLRGYRQFLAALESTPAQPVREGQEGKAEPITAEYTNWRGERSVRSFIPHRVFWGSNEWHPEPQVLIEGFDCEKDAVRTFAAAGFASQPDPAAEIARVRGLLARCRTVLGNMAMENEGGIFNRWPISHEPLRADAKHLLPLIDEEIGHEA